MPSMKTKDAIEHFGSEAAVARALEISRQAVDQWGELVPILTAIEIQRITKDKLKVDPSLYRKARSG